MKYVVTRKPNGLNYMDEFDRFFGNFWDLPSKGINAARVPSVDVRENDDAYVLEAELPGFGEGDVEVNVEKHILHISSKKEETKEEEKGEYLMKERSVSSFQRSFALPEQVDEEQITGEFKNGVLTLTIPKTPVEKPKKIAIKLAS
ncbi:MAG: Hsp20/alpha crystallin family protein [Spirochaetia bacterium]|nr:Hsp20/alpha crystallin family protein [Spirochaetia bacterium]MCF7940915.1 Hsp20/alpha crystallin family protein [Spirochaetia bacterium]